MSDIEKMPASSNWGEVLVGGLPQMLMGPAGKAISRLVAGAANIPAAWLEQKAQAIRDETAAKSRVMEALSHKSAELGLSDPLLLERGLNSLLGRAYQEQENREAVAKAALEYLAEDPPPKESPGPSDDWLNSFEDKTARATSEEIRALFGRILAGEIRAPGSFSLATLQFVSVLDLDLAEIIQKIAPFIWIDIVAKDGIDANQVTFADLLALEEAGILTLGRSMLTVSKSADENGVALYANGPIGVAAKFLPKTKISLGMYSVSRVGKELVRALDFGLYYRSFADALWKLGPESVQFCIKTDSGAFVPKFDLPKRTT